MENLTVGLMISTGRHSKLFPIRTWRGQHGLPGEDSVGTGHETHSLFGVGQFLPTCSESNNCSWHNYPCCCDSA